MDPVSTRWEGLLFPFGKTPAEAGAPWKQSFPFEELLALPADLLHAAFHTQPNPRAQHTWAFFCSALVAYCCVELGFLPKEDLRKIEYSEA